MEDVAGKQSAGVDCPFVISVCGTEILMEKFDIQKLVVYATDLDEKIPVAPVFGPLGPQMVKSRTGIKKLNLLRFAAYGFVDFFSLKAKQKSKPNPNKGK